ncbi:SPL family radical SAM protein [Clostridium sediminicola]|uniref:SPL family radical SAM protein n=1 Tax=Clostridium sediminicola TaxID=3114879 RepID=UPI003D170D53
MNNMVYKEITCKKAINKLKRAMPYSWDLNLYGGCEHGCKYCYAMYTKQYGNTNDFFNEIHIKTNVIEQIEKQLRSANWKREVINIGGVTDSYQPIEEKYKLMPEVLKLLIKYKTPAIISTKSDLILRDYDLIDELSRITYVNIAATITTTDENLRKKIEPKGAPWNKRFQMLKTFRNTNASTGLHVMPIIPYLTDSYENIDSLFYNAKNSDVYYVLPGTLYLRGYTRRVFLNFIKIEFPKVYNDMLEIYKSGGADREYKNSLYKMVNKLREKYSLSSSYSNPMKEKLRKNEYEQIKMF